MYSFFIIILQCPYGHENVPPGQRKKKFNSTFYVWSQMGNHGQLFNDISSCALLSVGKNNVFVATGKMVSTWERCWSKDLG